MLQIELEKQIIHAEKVEIHNKPKDYRGQFLSGFFWVLGAFCGVYVIATIAKCYLALTK